MKRAILFLMLFASSVFLFAQNKPESDKPSADNTSQDKPALDKPNEDKPSEDKAAQDKPAPAKSMADQAQEAKNPVTTALKEMLEHQQKNLTEAFEEMPADKFGYKPTEQQMTFGHVMQHVALSNIDLCRKIGAMPPPPIRPAPETDKGRLHILLNKSFLYCAAALSRVDDSKLGEKLELFGGKEATRAYAMIALANDWADHYSMAAMYLRLNGLLPPTAQKK